jgi:hypothetical protein
VQDGARATIILIVSRQRAQGRCFWIFGIPKPRRFFMDQARYEKRSSTAKGLLLGVCFVTEDPKKEHLRKVFSEASTEAIIYEASA